MPIISDITVPQKQLIQNFLEDINLIDKSLHKHLDKIDSEDELNFTIKNFIPLLLIFSTDNMLQLLHAIQQKKQEQYDNLMTAEEKIQYQPRIAALESFSDKHSIPPVPQEMFKTLFAKYLHQKTEPIKIEWQQRFTQNNHQANDTTPTENIEPIVYPEGGDVTELEDALTNPMTGLIALIYINKLTQ